ncbi:polysaccharide biosynthesis protein [Undibacterium terreum]|uniref:Polysaccharide biosynthesis protein n=1 Tax=Undibacterium terreum TaxID=1224302 RepID=A0A916UQV3_9BURK|nr:polysaccharide biosynthesis protein [Undibacterium terreum]
MLRNIVANYASQLYVILIGLAVVPLYIKYMGMEAYGVIGFFAMLQSWMTLLDLGLSPTLGREASKLKAGVTSPGVLKLFLRFLEILFSLTALLIVALSWILGSWIATYWLKLESLSPSDVALCVVLVACIISLRLLSGIYRGGLLGMERQVVANVIAVIAATLKSVAVLPLLIWITPSILAFFLFQLIAAIVEIFLMRMAFIKVIPSAGIEKFRWKLLQGPLRFGAGLAFLSAVWIVISQSDKLILSHILPMQNYGEFMLATSVAWGAYSLISPLQQAVLPRLVVLFEQNQHDKFTLLYRQTTMLMAAILAGVAGAMAAYPEHVLFAWTGNATVAARAAEILRWYVSGSSFMALAGMAYVLQHARGDLRMHIRGNLLNVFILVPSTIVLTLKFGAIGAAITWAGTNLFFLIVWTRIVHKKFLPEIANSWLFKDVFPAVLIGALVVIIGFQVDWPMSSRLTSFIGLVMLVVLISGLTLLIHQETKRMMSSYLKGILRFLCTKNA